MLDFVHLQEYQTTFPVRSFLGSEAEALGLSDEHQAQIHFLNAEATSFVSNYLAYSAMLSGPSATCASPFRERYFKSVEKLGHSSTTELRKWLYRRGIPFKNYVLLYVDGISQQAVLLTWKMVIKYADRLFRAYDAFLFDETLNWGLFYDHHLPFTFGKNRVFDPEEEYEKMRELHELKLKYPFLKFAY